jgi:hypothetical protein
MEKFQWGVERIFGWMVDREVESLVLIFREFGRLISLPAAGLFEASQNTFMRC